MLNVILREKKALFEFNNKFNVEYDHLKPMQLKCLRGLQEDSVVSVIPTGYGKSLIFELLPWYIKYTKNMECSVIIIVPLNSLVDQECKKLGDSVCHIQSHCRGPIAKKQYCVGHPEDILDNIVSLSNILKDRYVFIVVDEAHCILEWGKDFRPEYKLLGELRPHFHNVKMLAITASASKEAQTAIAVNLGMITYVTISNTPTLNKNIFISVKKRPASTGGNNSVVSAYDYVYKQLLLDLMKLGHNYPLTIVYCQLKWCAYGIELARRILPQSQMNTVMQYHAQQPNEVHYTYNIKVPIHLYVSES